MKASTLKYGVLSSLVTLISLIILLIPFHAFLTVWLSTWLGHYTALRLWKEVLLLVCALGVLYLVCFDRKVRFHTVTRKLTWLIVAYVLVQAIWGAVAFRQHQVGAKALGYGLIVNLRFLAFFLITWAVAVRTTRLDAKWRRLVIWPAVLVVVFGLLQIFVLPKDFLHHFGYGPHTIWPYETINHNEHYVRVQSMLRGANALGAYLLVPLSAVTALILRGQRQWRWLVLGLALFTVLLFTFSRSAWIGAVLCVVTVLAMELGVQRLKTGLLWGGATVVLMAAGLTAGLRHNARFESVFLHTQTHSSARQSSNSAHTGALRTGLNDLAHEPLGRGPGTAGPASVYNIHPSRISENYYIQVGQEVGWLGLALFLAINGIVAYLLWVRRADPLALTLFASLIGISFVNLLSHAWTDDTLSYLWWGLAGMVIARLPQPAAEIQEPSE